MYKALNHAKTALSKNELPIGAIIVNSNGVIIATAHNEVEGLNDVTAHAEILAIKRASIVLGEKFLTNTCIYVTLEPCAMCLAAISFARISKIFYGAENNKFGAITNDIKLFNKSNAYHCPEIYCGILKEESLQLLSTFFNR